MKKVNAVEWLVDYLKNIKELPFIRQNLNIHEQNILNDIIEQAKEMDKKDKHSEYMRGWKDGYSKQELKSE
jgi:hypothetical protein